MEVPKSDLKSDPLNPWHVSPNDTMSKRLALQIAPRTHVKSSPLQIQRFGRKQRSYLTASATILFQRGMLLPYIVPEEDLESGYSDPDDCRPIPGNDAPQVNEFYEKRCQEKSSTSAGGETFSRDPAHDN